MAELGIIAAVVQIADVGLRLSIKLYTFGEIVASADRSVISISKDVSLTSGVLKELGQILEKDSKSRTFSENAVETADGIVKECLEVFQEMDSILVKKLPSLGAGRKEDKREERPKRAMVMLEKLKWGYLRPKLQLLRSNLDRLKSTLLLMLNVITYAKQVSEKTESPSVIAEQRSLIEDLAHSNQEYIRKFEDLRLAIGEDAIEDAETISKAGAVETELSTKTEPVPPAPKHKFDSMNFATLRTPLQDEENVRGLGFSEPTTTTKLSPNAPGGVTKSLATPPNADINNLFTNTGGQSNIAMPPLQVQEKPTTEAPLAFDQEVLFKQLRYFSMLVQDLLKEVDAPRYKITFQSRLRMKGGIAGLHEGERRELEKMWGCTALQKAEQRLDSFIEEFEELPAIRRSVKSNNFACDSLWLHSAATSHSEDDKWPSLFEPQTPSALKTCQPHKSKLMCKPQRSRPRKEAKAEGPPKNTADNTGQSTDAPIVGTSAASMEFNSGSNSLEAGLDASHSMPLNSDLDDVGVRANCDIEHFLHEEDSNFDPEETNRSLRIMVPDPDGALEPTSLPLKKADNDIRQPPLPCSESIDSIYNTMGDEYVEPGQTPDMFERESKQDVSQLADMELVDHLVSLWTTLKL